MDKDTAKKNIAEVCTWLASLDYDTVYYLRRDKDEMEYKKKEIVNKERTLARAFVYSILNATKDYFLLDRLPHKGDHNVRK